jgi:hypothetical protein
MLVTDRFLVLFETCTFCLIERFLIGEVPEWPKGADCKSAGEAFGGSNPPLSTMIIFFKELAGIAQLARASAFQAEGRGFESRFPLHIDFGLIYYG